jgi:hypothetical protein
LSQQATNSAQRRKCTIRLLRGTRLLFKEEVGNINNDVSFFAKRCTKQHLSWSTYILASCAVLATTECERTQPGSNSPVKVKTSCTHDHNSVFLILIRGCDGKL